MPNAGLAEIYFIAAMFVLILITCGVALFFFFRTYNLEKRAKEEARKQNSIQKQKSEIQD